MGQRQRQMRPIEEERWVNFDFTILSAKLKIRVSVTIDSQFFWYDSIKVGDIFDPSGLHGQTFLLKFSFFASGGNCWGAEERSCSALGPRAKLPVCRQPTEPRSLAFFAASSRVYAA